MGVGTWSRAGHLSAVTPSAPAGPVHPRLRAWQRHRGLLLLLAVAALGRLVVVIAYVPALSFADSADYLRAADLSEPLRYRPFGYSALIGLLDGIVPFRAVAVVQHVFGLVVVGLVYALLQHRGVSRRLSLLAVVPVALDAYVLDLEHFVLAESLFMLELALAVVVLLWRARPPAWAAAAAGLLLASAALTRTVGTALLVVVAAYLLLRCLLRSLSWTALVAFALAAAALVLPYRAWFHSTYGVYATTDYTGHFLYGRVSDFVECDRIELPARLRALCPTGPPGARPQGDFYVWDVASPANTARWSEQDLREFAVAAIKGQPGGFVATTLRRTLHYAEPGRPYGPHDTCSGYWRFPDPTVPALKEPCPGRLTTQGFEGAPVYSGVRLPVARALRDYQRVGYTPGPVLALCVVLAAAAAVRPLRRATGGTGGPDRLTMPDRLDPVLLAAIGVVLVLVPSATSSFDYRYVLPSLVVLPAAGVLALRRAPSGPPA